nr:MAG TPA: hypothetical protein [Caudoviricetes sp.]
MLNKKMPSLHLSLWCKYINHNHFQYRQKHLTAFYRQITASYNPDYLVMIFYYVFAVIT